MSNEKIVNADFRNQVLPRGLVNTDPPNSQGHSENEYHDKINPEEYIQHEIDAQIEEYYTLTSLEDLFPFVMIDVDDFIFELVCELKKRLVQAKTESHQSDNSATIQKYENWISILKYIDGFMTSQELDVLDKCIGTYASVCNCPYERRDEIIRNMCYLNSWFEIDLLEFDSKIYRIDVQILYELTEILLKLENLFYYSPKSNNSFHSLPIKNVWPISTFYYYWEIFEIDCIEWYEMQAEITWVKTGLIQDIWNSDHVTFIMDEHNGVSTEYDYYTNQFIDNDQHVIDRIELGDLECLIEDDLFKDTWSVAGKEFPNFIDYFWEAEITDLCQNKDGDFYTENRDYFSEHRHDTYSKYLCYQDDSGFNYCNKDSCDGCRYFGSKKELNQQYVLWQKYVQPLESE